MESDNLSRQRTRDEIAIHEAGHLVFMVRYEIPVIRVSITPEEHRGGTIEPAESSPFMCRAKSGDQEAIAALMTSIYGGIYAEMKFCHVPFSMGPDDRNSLASLASWLPQNIDKDGFQDQQRWNAIEMLSLSEWENAIRVLAGALLNGNVDSAVITDIVRNLLDLRR